MSKEKIPLKTKKIEKELVFILDESIPKDATGRKQYMSDVAYFYATIFKEKLNHFVSLQLIELARIGRTESEYQIIRANINAFRVIDEWFDTHANEHFGDLEQMRNSFENNEDFINGLKDKYIA